MKRNITDYNTFVFDCDGVLLNSNMVKTNAFYQAVLPYGEAAAKQLVEYHVQNGGISRYKKFAYFLENIVNKNQEGPDLDLLLSRYATEVLDGLMSCDIADGLAELREKTGHARWLIASGGDQEELREVFRARNIAFFFDGGIFGSPDTKEDILSRELKLNGRYQPALFIGDSKYDFLVAKKFNMDFAYVSCWSEWEPANQHSSKFNINLLNLSELISV
ncbi:MULTISPECIES: HAD family hydrolase [unclassified Halomonas]|uniref:HAD family hydrolase n=1 Tax=unclassified Halomonas TaxID=2609666 RepID=UPI0040338D45